MIKYRVPSTCIYCDNFPCIKGDEEFSVVSELKNSYPFASERDDLKPCEGRKFNPIDFAVYPDPPAGTDEDPIPLPAPKVELAEDESELIREVKVLRATTDMELEAKIKNILMNDNVKNFEIKGFASVYDANSNMTKMVLVLELFVEQDEDDELPNISLEE